MRVDDGAVVLTRNEGFLIDLAYAHGGEWSLLVGGRFYEGAERLVDCGLLARAPASDVTPTRLAYPFRHYRLTDTGAEIARVRNAP